MQVSALNFKISHCSILFGSKEGLIYNSKSEKMSHPLSLDLHLVRCTGVRTKEELISQYFKEMGGELHG